MPGKVKGLLERLRDNEPVIVAEGYLFEFERRGYLKAGTFVPEVVLDHPDVLKQLYAEFVHAGSDVVQAFTFYAHREKMRLIGREDELEKMNRQALRIAREVADETNTLMAGNICMSTVFAPNDESRRQVRDMFTEQIRWAVEEGADLLIGESWTHLEEAMIALDVMKMHGNGLPIVMTMYGTAHGECADGTDRISEACRKMAEAGADVVGVNCMNGLNTVLDTMKEIKKVCNAPLACVPVPFRTTDKERLMLSLTDPVTGDLVFPDQMDQMLIPRRDVAPFVKALQDMGVNYMGLCCGNRSFYTRSMAEALGRKPPASKYSPDMSMHFMTFNDETHKASTQGFQRMTKPT